MKKKQILETKKVVSRPFGTKYVNLNKQIYLFRIKSKLKQSELGELAGIHAAFINRYENYTQLPSPKSLEAFNRTTKD